MRERRMSEGEEREILSRMLKDNVAQPPCCRS